MDRFAPLSARAEQFFTWLPDWLLSLAVAVLFMIVAWQLHAILFRLAKRLVQEQNLFRRSLISRTEAPSRLAFFMLAVSLAAFLAPLPLQSTGLIRQIILVGLIVLLGWFAMTALHIWTTLHLRRFKLDSEDNLLARKHVTQSRILQRTGQILIVIVTASAAMMTFDSVRQFGVGLLASAGAAGIVLGLALQPILKNLIAGIQLALTQPIRIDDALLIENEWGNVEEITSAYVVIRLWDWRRLVVPLSYFIEKPFQNWTRESASLIGTVYLYTDFTVPVAALRAKLAEVLKTSKLWDGQVMSVQVTDFKQHTMEIRMLMSAKDSPRAFDLRCEVREQMIAYLQDAYPGALPRLRGDLSDHRQPSHAAAPARTARA